MTAPDPNAASKAAAAPTPDMWVGWESVQASRLLGTYQPNNSLIRINRDAAFWLDHQDDRQLERYATFAHEYTHYLHNYSTVAGITDFCLHLQSAYFFLKANNEQGRCRGSEALTPEEQQTYRQLLELQIHIRGDIRRPSATQIHGPHPTLRTLSLTPTKFDSKSLAGPMQRIEATMKFESVLAEPVEASFRLGYLILDEAIAYNLEKLILQRAGRSSQALEDRTPAFPYKIVESLIHDRTSVTPTPEQVVKTGVLALQSADCGAQFVEVLRHLVADPNNFDATLLRLTQEAQSHLARDGDILFEKLVDPTIKDFTKLLADGIRYHRDQCRFYLQTRTKEPFFELELADIHPDDIARFTGFVDRFPPCPIIQTGGEIEDMFYLRSQDVDNALTQAIGAFQAFGFYLHWHRSPVELIPTDYLPALECCFRGSCAVPFAVANPKVCQTKPWNSYDPAMPDLCWFATAVAHSRRVPPIDPPTSAADSTG